MTKTLLIVTSSYFIQNAAGVFYLVRFSIGDVALYLFREREKWQLLAICGLILVFSTGCSNESQNKDIHLNFHKIINISLIDMHKFLVYL